MYCERSRMAPSEAIHIALAFSSSCEGQHGMVMESRRGVAPRHGMEWHVWRACGMQQMSRKMNLVAVKW